MTKSQPGRIRQSLVMPVSAWAVVCALIGVFGLVTMISTTNGHSTAALRSHDGQLEAISERAERLQAYSRNIREASLSGPDEVNLPFAGFVGEAGTVAPGARLKLLQSGLLPDHSLEIVSSQKLLPNIRLAKASPGRVIDVMLVTGRVVSDTGSDAVDGPLVRFLVAVTPAKPPLRSVLQSL